MTDVISNHDKSIKIGRRVSVGTHYGTVRYVGSIPDTDFIWAGIEWDDSSRGKHDGIHNGVRYFKTL